MTPRQYVALHHWLEYCKLMESRHWMGYSQHPDGTLR
jgi:hypothetical protein